MKEDDVRDLMEQAGPRSDPPPEHMFQIKSAFRARWEDHVRKTHRPRISTWNLAWAAAAVVALGLGLWWWTTLVPTPGIPVGQVVAVEGDVTMHRGRTTTALEPGGEVSAGAELTTGKTGRVALRLDSGTSLRLDSGTRVLVESVSAVTLERGALYADTGPTRSGGASIRVTTPLGVVTDVGTQFEVRLVEEDRGAVRVSVREGLVRIEGEETSGTAEAGVQLTLFAQGTFARADFAPHDPAWEWVVDLAPPFELEGRTLTEFLEWVTRETGREIRYADPKLEEVAQSIVLHGSMGDVTPSQAPDVVLPGAGLEHRVEEGVLIVGPPAEP